MIVLWTGSPGSGKSYALVRVAVNAVERGRPVATNIPFADGWADQVVRSNVFRRWCRSRAYRDRLARRYERLLFVSDSLEELLRVRFRGEGEARALVVLDESHRWLNSRTWDAGVGATKDEAVAARLDLVRYFSAHRHYGVDVHLGTQDANNIDRQVRGLFEYLIVVKNLRRLRIAGIPIVPVNFFVAIWTWNDRARSVVKREVYRLNKRVAGLYHTHALAEQDVPEDVIWMPRPGGAPAQPATSPPPAAPPPPTSSPPHAGSGVQSSAGVAGRTGAVAPARHDAPPALDFDETRAAGRRAAAQPLPDWLGRRP